MLYLFIYKNNFIDNNKIDFKTQNLIRFDFKITKKQSYRFEIDFKEMKIIHRIRYDKMLRKVCDTSFDVAHKFASKELNLDFSKNVKLKQS